MNTVFLGLHVADVPVGLHWPATRAASMATIVDSSFAAIHRGTAIDAPASKQNLVLENSSFDASVTCAISGSDGCSRTTKDASGFVWRSDGRGTFQSNKPAQHLEPIDHHPIPQPSRPTFDNETVCNALDFGVGASADDTAALKRAIAACTTIFLPNFGTKSIVLSSTVLLKANTSLVGESYTAITLAARSPGFDDVDHPKPMLVLPQDPSANNRLVDLALTSGAGNGGAVLLEWGAGRAQAFDVHFRSGSVAGSANCSSGAVHTQLHVVGPGGGVITNSWGWGALVVRCANRAGYNIK